MTAPGDASVTPRLILIGGPPGVGKTTVARDLFTKLSGSAWLDGDDVWRMNPFVADERTKPLVEANIPFVLAGYLRARFPWVILSWVLHADALVERILSPLLAVDHELSSFTLVCGEGVLRARLAADPAHRDHDVPRALGLLARARDVHSVQIDTSELSPAAVTGLLLAHIRRGAEGEGDADLRTRAPRTRGSRRHRG